MNQNEFMSLLVAELTNQDPFSPMETTDMLNQIMMLQDLKSAENLTNGMNGMLHESRMASAASLLGTTVRGISTAQGDVVGVVTGIAITGNSGELVLNGDGATRIPLSNVTDVKITVVPEPDQSTE